MSTKIKRCRMVNCNNKAESNGCFVRHCISCGKILCKEHIVEQSGERWGKPNVIATYCTKCPCFY